MAGMRTPFYFVSSNAILWNSDGVDVVAAERRGHAEQRAALRAGIAMLTSAIAAGVARLFGTARASAKKASAAVPTGTMTARPCGH